VNRGEGRQKKYFMGESAICWSLGDAISSAGSARVLRVHRALKKLQREAKLDVLDVVPSYNSVAVYFNPISVDIQQIQDHVQAVIDDDDRTAAAKGSTPEILGKRTVLPVQYDGEDIERVAAHTGLSWKDVISLHVNATYSVAMIGFLPHFPYLIGLNQKLITPRLDKPRTHVPADRWPLEETKLAYTLAHRREVGIFLVRPIQHCWFTLNLGITLFSGKYEKNPTKY